MIFRGGGKIWFLEKNTEPRGRMKNYKERRKDKRKRHKTRYLASHQSTQTPSDNIKSGLSRYNWAPNNIFTQY
jgi:hypothetical protein